uniref:Major sperm protein n=1 Tax=Strongyloides papillosus TaxID=174720 RepID=A0A0N5BR59_STREA
MENFLLKLKPFDKITFPKPIPGNVTSESRLLIKNNGHERVAVKIKCTNNKMFKISPVFSSADVGEARLIRLIFITENDVPMDGKHHFSIHVVPSPESETVCEAFNSEKGKNPLTIRIPIFFEKKFKRSNTEEKITYLYNEL